jgi:A/G-specific adenine glycosylase
MELGALICIPKNPRCSICPLNKFCKSFHEDLVDIIPFKSKKKSKPEITAIVQITQQNSKYIIAKRKNTGLLGGFWEFPMENVKSADLIEYQEYHQLKEIKHSYTHFNLRLIPVFIRKKKLKLNNNLYVEKKWVKIDEIKKYPVHRAMQKVLESIEIN